MSVFILIPKKGNAKKYLSYHTVALISHASKFMFKMLQARFQQYVNWEFPDVEAEFRKGRETQDQITNICWILERAREFQINFYLSRNFYFCFIEYAKPFDSVDHNKLWKIPDNHNCYLRKLYAGQKTRVKTRYRKMDWFRIRKSVQQSCILSPFLFNLYTEYIMWNAWLDKSQAGFQIAGRNINVLRYACDTTLMKEREKELRSLLMRVKGESGKSWLKS